jgi:hypothetical protein
VTTDSPISVKQILNLTPARFLEKLMSISDRIWTGFNNDRRGLLEEASRAVQANFNWGHELAEELLRRDALDSDAWDSILDGWKESLLEEPEWRAALQLLGRSEALIKAHAMPIARFLETRLEQREKKPVSHSIIGQSLSLSRSVWSQAPDLPEPNGPSLMSNWLHQAINNAAGVVSMYLVRALAHLRKLEQDGDEDEELHTTIMAVWRLLEAMLSQTSNNSPAPRIIFGSQLHLFWSIDPDWTCSHLLPFFDWDADPVAAKQVWDGFLFWGRPYDALVPDLLPDLLKTFAHLDELGELREQVASLLAVLLLFSSTEPESWLNEFLTHSGAEDRRYLAWEVGPRLRELKPGQVKASWDARIQPLVRRRLEGLPQLDNLEWEAIVGWAPHLLSVLDEFVDLVYEGPELEVDRNGGDVILAFARMEIGEAIARPVARLVARVLEGVHDHFYLQEQVRTLARKLAAAGAPKEELGRILDEASRLGCGGSELADELGVGGGDKERA